MGGLKIIQAAPWMSIQDKGRFGCFRFGIPKSGVMDVAAMEAANARAGNQKHFPVIEFALGRTKVEASSDTAIGLAGVSGKVNGKSVHDSLLLKAGELLELDAPHGVFGYLSLSGLLQAQEDFGSYSTYEAAALGGLHGRNLRKGDTITSTEEPGSRELVFPSPEPQQEKPEGPVMIRVLKGPEFRELCGSLNRKTFTIQSDSNRMGIRLKGDPLTCQINEMESSAVIPGIIQLPSGGQPVVLMNDCQTIGGYPRIAKVTDEDLSKLAQLRPGSEVQFYF